MSEDHQEVPEHKHFLPLWVRVAIVVIVLLLTAAGSVLGIIFGSWSALPTVIFSILGVVLAFSPLLPSLFPVKHKDITSVASHSAPGNSSMPVSLSQNVQVANALPQQREGFIDPATSLRRLDWGDAPNKEFFGRHDEITILKRLVLEDHCKVVAVYGMGGIGKTSLVATVAHQIEKEFICIIWRSLRNLPPLRTILSICIQATGQSQSIVNIPDDVEEQIAILIRHFRERRCLLILDNVEAILQAGGSASQYIDGFEDYQKLFLRVGSSEHQSCLILTSREKLQDITSLEGQKSSVRSLLLSGITDTTGVELLKNKGLSGSDAEYKALIAFYAGSPLALELVAEPIQELFQGNISEFLRGKEVTMSPIRTVLQQQFQRLSQKEQEIMYWLAIEREPVPVEILKEDVLNPINKRSILETIMILKRKLLVESVSVDGSNCFDLQTFIAEYILENFVEAVYHELDTEELSLFENHMLIKAQTKDYVRESQKHFILKPLLESIIPLWRESRIEAKFKRILVKLRQAKDYKHGYAAGNILNMLAYLGINLSGYNFSRLTIRQAYLQGLFLCDVKFVQASFVSCVFTDTFGGVLSVAWSPTTNLAAAGAVNTDTFGGVLSVAWSPTTNLVAAGTINGEIRVWNATDGTLFGSYVGHTSWVRSLMFSSDGTTLVSGCDDETIRLWDIATGHSVLYKQKSWIGAVTFSPDGNLIACTDDNDVNLLDAHTGVHLKTLHGHTSWVRSLAFNPDGTILIAGAEDGSIRVWNIESGQCLQVLQGHSGPVRSIILVSNGTVFASGSDDQTVQFWDLHTGQHLRTLQAQIGKIRSLALSPDEKLLAAACDNNILLWNMHTDQSPKILQVHNGRVRSVAFSPDGSTLLSGGEDRTVRLWNVRLGECFRTWQGYYNPIRTVAFSRDGKLMASGSEEETVQIWDVHTGQLIKNIPPYASSAHGIRSIAFNADSNVLAVGYDLNAVRLWDVNTSRSLKALQGHQQWMRSVAFSPLDRTLLASGSEDKTIRLWDTDSGQCLKVLQGHESWVRSLTFSPLDKALLASSSDDKTIRLWNTDTGQCVNVLRDHLDHVRSVVFSPDGKLLASGSDDETVRIWDTTSGQCLYTLQGHKGWIRSVAFNPDGTLLASGGDDGTVRIWDCGSWQCLQVLQKQSGQIWCVAFHPYDAVLISGGVSGTIDFWNVLDWQLIRELRTNRPYENMDITGATGLTEGQRDSLRLLGAKDNKQ